MAEIVIPILSALLSPILSDLMKAALSQNTESGVEDVSIRIDVSRIERLVKKAKGILDRWNGPNSEILMNLANTQTEAEIYQDVVNYIFRYECRGNIPWEQIENQCDKLLSTLGSLIDEFERTENQSSGNASQMPLGNVRRFLLFLSLFHSRFVFNRKRATRLFVARAFTPEGSSEPSLQQLSGWIEVIDSSWDGDGAHFRIGNNYGNQNPQWPETDSFLSHNALAQSTGNFRKEKFCSSLIFQGLSNRTLDLEKREFLFIRILSLRNVKLKNQKHLKKLSCLRYLDLKHTIMENCDWLKGLEELQMLDLRYTGVKEIPDDCLEELQKLQHLLLGYIPTRGVNRLAGVKLNIKKLRTGNLKTLRAIRWSNAIRGDFGNVVDLSVTGLKTDDLKLLWPAITNLNLTSLGVAVTEGCTITLQDCPQNLKKNLERLRMEGQFKVGSTSAQPHSGLDKLREFKKLVDLTLVSPRQIEIDNLPSLPTLICLRLYDVRGERNQEARTLKFQKQVFMNLKKLVIGDMKMLETVQIGRVVIQTVATLKLCNLPEFTKLVCLESQRPLLTREQRAAMRLEEVHSEKNIFLRGTGTSSSSDHIHFKRSPGLKIYYYNMDKQSYEEVN